MRSSGCRHCGYPVRCGCPVRTFSLARLLSSPLLPCLVSEAEDAADGSATAEEEASDDGDDAAEDGGAAGPGRGSTVSGCTSPNGGSAEYGHDDPLRPTRRRLRS